MNKEYDNFEEWLDDVFSVFWHNGRFFLANTQELIFLYEDDATPSEIFDLYGY